MLAKADYRRRQRNRVRPLCRESWRSGGARPLGAHARLCSQRRAARSSSRLAAKASRRLTDGRCCRSPALKITPVDTVGAGDTFCGYFAAGLACGVAARAGAAPRGRCRLARLPEARRAAGHPAGEGRRRGAPAAGLSRRISTSAVGSCIMSRQVWSLYNVARISIPPICVACLFIALLPGPTITLIIATSIRHGTRAGLPMSPVRRPALARDDRHGRHRPCLVDRGMGHWFEWLRLIGAAYLIWMGIQMFRSSGQDRRGRACRRRRAAASCCKACSSRPAIRRR